MLILSQLGPELGSNENLIGIKKDYEIKPTKKILSFKKTSILSVNNCVCFLQQHLQHKNL
jgi:hypothetical protein